MDPLFQDERISAYLDGQMPPDERSQFEDELARNAELRQVVEELRGLHDSLQALPKHRLNDDFSQQVLRRAERAMLSDSNTGANGADGSATEDSHVVTSAAKTSISDVRKSRRPWIWAAVAIAVAVMLMVLSPPPKKHVELAQNTDSTRQAGAPQRDKSEHVLHEGKMFARAKRSGDPRSLAEEGRPADASGEKERLRSVAGDIGANAAPQDGPAPAAGFGGRREVEKKISPAPMPQAASASGLAGQPQYFGGAVDHLAAKGAAADAKNVKEAAHREPHGVAANRGESAKVRSFSNAAGEHVRGSLPAGEMIVAEYATPTEVSKATWQRLLERRGITLNESPAALLAMASAVRTASSGNVELAKSPSDRGAIGGVAAPAAVLKLADSDRSLPALAAGEEPLEVVYVVGTRKQVMGLVADLHSQPAQYRTLAVSAITPEAIDTREADAKGLENRLAHDDYAGAADKDSNGEGLATGARKQTHALAPAAPQSPPVPVAAPRPAVQDQPAPPQDAKLDEAPGSEPAVAADGPTGRAVVPPAAKKEAPKRPIASKPGAGEAAANAPIVAEQKAGQKAEGQAADAAAPQAEPAVPSPIAVSEAAAEPAESANRSGWATQMMSLPSETENVLRQSLAQRGHQPGEQLRQRDMQKERGGGQGSAAINQEQDAGKAKSDAQSNQQADQQDGLARLDGGSDDEQVQAVFVFRLVPGKAIPAAAGGATK